MIPQQNSKTELIIVCDDKTRAYGNYLIQLIGQKDDSEDGAIGIKDGTVSAAIWMEKEYQNSQAKVGSSTHVLFVGNGKVVQEQAKFIKHKFNKYGMHYGWMGKRAVMFVDADTIKKAAYNEFLEFAHSYQQNFKKEKLNAINSLPEAVKWVGVFLPVVYPVAIYGIITSKIKKLVKEQQYQCLSLVLYLDDLQNFIEA